MELTLPDEPVALAPGVPTRVPVQLRNPYAQPLDLRIYLARGRAAGWATVEPPQLSLRPGETAEVAVVLTTPAEQPPSSSLVPFTVHAEEASTGEPAGFATALLKVALPVPVTGSLVARREKHTYDLWLANDTRRAAPLRITAELDPPSGQVRVEPDAVLLEPGARATVAVRAKPGRPVTGQPRPFAVLIKVSDVYDTERPPYLTEVATGKSKPLVRAVVLGTVAIVVLVAATALIALHTGGHGLFTGRLFKGRDQAAAAPQQQPVEQVTVTRPYALIDVFPHSGGQAAAQAELTRLTAGGMPVRLVDSFATDVLSDQNGGFWVLLQDGFRNQQEAATYCERWRTLAPKCQVTS
ncbi:hypothetical protein ODJ79_26690 [Actinoplanes sp. KI2]|uniref:COG1470 family protein n=1 Tax=Actinoplanes sp. KI2 TaxID=2983315 RepID=UPI0021D5B417|nr:hypothetical protein [Actinoplanes sp. KI2]MCU7727334.1 hypothetical protein [Actinoplanes sp. KI2]